MRWAVPGPRPVAASPATAGANSRCALIAAVTPAGADSSTANRRAFTPERRYSAATSLDCSSSCPESAHASVAAPGVDIALIRALGLDAGVERVHVGFMGCQGALNGLRVARALALASPNARVLLCCVELCGLHLQYSGEPDLVVANSLFADGAAAAVVGIADGGQAWRLAASGAALLPDSLDAMTWSIGDHGFTMTLSPRVPALIEAHLGPWLAGWLARHGLAIGDVASWAIHPGGTRVVGAVERALGLDARAGAAAREVLAEHGNMSSPTVLFVLERLRARGAATPCVALAFGPGLSVEAALLA